MANIERYFGQFGVNHYPPGVRPALEELTSTYQKLRQSPEFQRELNKVRIGSAIGPHPFPMIVRDFQGVVGQEAREQFLSITNGSLPEHVVACVAGGSNTMDDGAPASVSSVASGLVYPGIGPEIAMLHQTGRLSAAAISDEEVISTFFRMAKFEGIIPALESAHTVAFAIRLASQRPLSERILVNLSGRGDKDVDYVLENYGTGVSSL
ncbi:tryptophan synthase beta subunit-like PLP-dependent enzyme [Aspergillus pseudocaelatus]|uniref:Tryptophan synthase beta subunit-like PLP-dependent enzyme n=1 Tax=Aspergillus pseudocaelatus TaxID=1825620 RepID=A0ABQ6W4Z1_9EURO|nr:tryptophan synthase beta subunit-like PLP-dependent enzyme [Aspergillus pseudocaelatus]